MSHVRCPRRGVLMFPMSCELHSPFLPPAATMQHLYPRNDGPLVPAAHLEPLTSAAAS